MLRLLRVSALNEPLSDQKNNSEIEECVRSNTNVQSCLATSVLCTATAYFLLSRGCPTSCAYYTKPMTTDSPNSAVGLFASKRYFAATDCILFRSLIRRGLLGVVGCNLSYHLSLGLLSTPCSVCFSHTTAGNMAVTVQRAHSGKAGKGFSTAHKHIHVT